MKPTQKSYSHHAESECSRDIYIYIYICSLSFMVRGVKASNRSWPKDIYPNLALDDDGRRRTTTTTDEYDGRRWRTTDGGRRWRTTDDDGRRLRMADDGRRTTDDGRRPFRSWFHKNMICSSDFVYICFSRKRLRRKCWYIFYDTFNTKDLLFFNCSAPDRERVHVLNTNHRNKSTLS